MSAKRVWPMKNSKQYIYFTLLILLYIPYFIRFPMLDLSWPIYLIIISYTPLYFLLGFLLGMGYHIGLHLREKKLKAQRQTTKERSNMREKQEIIEDSLRHTREAVRLPRRISRFFPGIPRWGGRSREDEREVIWDAEDVERAPRFPIVDNSEVTRKRFEEGFDDIPLDPPMEPADFV